MEFGIDEILAPAKGEAARGLRSAKSKMIEVSLPAGDPRLPVPELPVRLSDIKTASALRTGKQAAAKAHLVKFDQLPFIERNAAGEPVRGLAIDRWAYTNGALLIAGWVIGVGDEEIRIDGAADGSDVLVSVFRRPDVEDAFPALRSTTTLCPRLMS